MKRRGSADEGQHRHHPASEEQVRPKSVGAKKNEEIREPYNSDVRIREMPVTLRA
jgi:hypothetical protein